MTRSEIQWRLRRSTLELDILLRRFFEDQYDQLSEEEKRLFQDWLWLEDPEWMEMLRLEHPLLDKIRGYQGDNGKP